jgi:hypothetical protein
MAVIKLYPKKAKTPLKAIRLFCFECMGISRTIPLGRAKKPIDDVKECTDEMCPLFEFRLGKNPYLKGKKGGNPAIAEIGQKYRVSINKK